MISIINLFRSPTRQATGYLIAIVSVSVATVLRWLLDPVFGDAHPLLLYYGAVALTAWCGGWWPALLAVVSGYLAADWFFMSPRRDVVSSVHDPTALLGCVTFLFTGTMIAAFSEAAKSARRRAEANARVLQLALESARMVTWKWNLRSDEIRVSSNIAQVIGATLPGQTVQVSHARAWVYPEDLPRQRDAILDAIGRCGDYVFQFRIIRPDNGAIVWLEDHAAVVCDPQGKVAEVSGIVMDITERKEAENQIRQAGLELERRVRERTAELQASNKELEAFSYTVSHDLRAPLRAISSFSQMVQDENGDKLDEQGRLYLDLVREGSQRMARLIDDLLYLSRVTRSELRRCPVALGKVAQRVIADLRRLEPERQVEVIIAPNLMVSGDEHLLQVVLENLLNNAWKFTANQSLARLEVGSEVRNGEQVVFVRDNGAGFDMAYAGKLFGVFQRLHSNREFPGNGIGLATVYRIITRHGGRVWAEGAVNQGATVYFTLPK